jgi:NtrC-family two-component system sensor histidine kinase KinB
MALTNTPGGDKILSAIRNAVSMQKAVAAEMKRRCCRCGLASRSAAYRLRTTPMRDSEGDCWAR